MISRAEKINIYFAGSIRGGRADAARYARLIRYLAGFGTVLTEHVGNEAILRQEKELSEREIFLRDMHWLDQADLVIAEVSTPSLGVGYELAAAAALNKPILCLHRPAENRELSAMIAGNPALQVGNYTTSDEAEDLIARWITSLLPRG